MPNILGRTALLLALSTSGAIALPAYADSGNDQLQSMSPSEIQSAIQALPPQLRGQIMQQLHGKSTEDLMRMSPDQAKAQLQNLSPDMKKQLKEQWVSMSSDQKAMIKSLNLHALMEKIRAMSGPELAMIRRMIEKALGTSSASAEDRR